MNHEILGNVAKSIHRKGHELNGYWSKSMSGLFHNYSAFKMHQKQTVDVKGEEIRCLLCCARASDGGTLVELSAGARAAQCTEGQRPV